MSDFLGILIIACIEWTCSAIMVLNLFLFLMEVSYQWRLNRRTSVQGIVDISQNLNFMCVSLIHLNVYCKKFSWHFIQVSSNSLNTLVEIIVVFNLNLINNTIVFFFFNIFSYFFGGFNGGNGLKSRGFAIIMISDIFLLRTDLVLSLPNSRIDFQILPVELYKSYLLFN